MSRPNHLSHLTEAVRLAMENRRRGARPFGAVLAQGDRIVTTGVNDMLDSKDPSSHAEMNALRAAGSALGRTDLSGCIVYASGHPCPMCLAALVLANVDAVYYAFGNDEAEPYGYSTAGVYRRLGITLAPPPLPLERLDVGMSPAQLYGTSHD